MKTIKLTQGKIAFVDDEDYEWLSQWKWLARWSEDNQSFYAIRNKWLNGKPRPISMAREILGLAYGDKLEADPINHKTLNNSRLNLRIVTHQQNCWNQKRIIKGYYWHRNRYETWIHVNGNRIYLGRFRKAKQAHGVYVKAKKQYHKYYKDTK